MDKPNAIKTSSFDSILPETGILVHQSWDLHSRTVILRQYKFLGPGDGNGLPKIPPPPSVAAALSGFKTAIPEFNMVAGIGKILTGWKVGDAGDKNGFNLVEINIEIDGGVANIQYVYKSISIADADGGGVIDVEVNAVAEEVSIIRHKDFIPMFSWYGAFIDEGYVYWMDFDPGNPSVSLSENKRKFGSAPKPQRKVVSQASQDATNNNNPLLGVQSFYEGRIEVSETRFYKSRANIPDDVVSKVGSVDNTTHEGEVCPILSEYVKKKWIRSGARISSSGSGYRVTRSWMLNNVNKQTNQLLDTEESMWIPEIYMSNPIPS